MAKKRHVPIDTLLLEMNADFLFRTQKINFLYRAALRSLAHLREVKAESRDFLGTFNFNLKLRIFVTTDFTVITNIKVRMTYNSSTVNLFFPLDSQQCKDGSDGKNFR